MPAGELPPHPGSLRITASAPLPGTKFPVHSLPDAPPEPVNLKKAKSPKKLPPPGTVWVQAEGVLRFCVCIAAGQAKMGCIRRSSFISRYR